MSTTSILSDAEARALENLVAEKRQSYFELYDRYPTKVFLDRTTYLKAIMTRQYASELNVHRTFLGMQLYQAVPVFGSGEPLVVVIE